MQPAQTQSGPAAYNGQGSNVRRLLVSIKAITAVPVLGKAGLEIACACEQQAAVRPLNQ